MIEEIVSASDKVGRAATMVDDYRLTFKPSSIATAALEQVMVLLLDAKRSLDKIDSGKQVVANS